VKTKPCNIGSLIFSLVLVVFFSILMIKTFEYDRVSRLVPLLVLIPSVALTLLSIVSEFKPFLLSKKYNMNLFNVKMGEVKLDKNVACNNRVKGNRGLMITAGWIIFLILCILLFGFLIAMPIAIFIFLKVADSEKCIKSLVFAVIVSALSYLLFDVVLNVELFKGILQGDYII
jgi:hypothetical protein